MHFNKACLVRLHSVLRGNQGPSCLAIYLAVVGNQSHREGTEMIQPRRAQERVRGKLGEGSMYGEGRTVLLKPIKLGALRAEANRR